MCCSLVQAYLELLHITMYLCCCLMFMYILSLSLSLVILLMTMSTTTHGYCIHHCMYIIFNVTTVAEWAVFLCSAITLVFIVILVCVTEAR